MTMLNRRLNSSITSNHIDFEINMDQFIPEYKRVILLYFISTALPNFKTKKDVVLV